jgi:hypothetical protein
VPSIEGWIHFLFLPKIFFDWHQKEKIDLHSRLGESEIQIKLGKKIDHEKLYTGKICIE